MTKVAVNVDNFVRAETDHMFAAIARDAGGVNRWNHNRGPTPLEHQPVIRMNRDTLYSAAVIDIRDGATITVPEAGDRYLSVMVLNQDHFVNAVIHEPGVHELTVESFDTDYVVAAARILVNPADPADIAAVNALQDAFELDAGSAVDYAVPDYDGDSYVETREAVLTLAKGLSGFARAFGRREQVDPVRHLLGTAAGWGGLPESEAHYVNVEPGLPVGAYSLTVREAPVDGFWSISLSDADGYFPTDTGGRVSVNNLTAQRDPDGSVTVHFGGDESLPNLLPIAEWWNYLVRFYQPHPEILDGTWSFPSVTAADGDGTGAQ
jgi:hypothetical protein